MANSKKRIQYRYDAVGNRSAMIDPDGGRFTYAYDAINRIKQVINPQGDRTSYAYDAGGRRTVKKLANGTRASFSYDAASNLTRLANLKSDGTTISSFNYEYDRVGNRTAVLEGDGSRVTWSYDDTYQLTGEHRTGTTPYEDSYTYDAAGNRLLKVHDGARTTYSYDAANQLEWSEDASGRTTYTFDADGNQQLVVEPTGDRTTTSWDYENRTTLVQLPSGIRNTMAYEPGGLRVKLEESTGTKKFVWDEQNYLAETDENDDTQVVYTNEPRMYGNLVSQRRGTESHWYHFDAIGSTRELTDATETVTDTRLYDAWGEILFSTGTTRVSFGFGGVRGYFTDSGGQLYVRARSYVPSIGRWLALDPFHVQILRVSTVSMAYAYALNSPINADDASGLLTQRSIPRECEDGGPMEDACVWACGSYWWDTEWVLEEGEDDGLIIQLVNLENRQRGGRPNWASACPDNDDDELDPCRNLSRQGDRCNKYIEVWRVHRRTVYSNNVFTAMPTDEFNQDSFANTGFKQCTKGHVKQVGQAIFVPWDIIANNQNVLNRLSRLLRRGAVQSAGDLFASCVNADNQDDVANLLMTIRRLMGIGESENHTEKYAEIRWNCCAEERARNLNELKIHIEAGGGPKEFAGPTEKTPCTPCPEDSDSAC